MGKVEYHKEFDTHEKAVEYMREIKGRYDPRGYGTCLNIFSIELAEEEGESTTFIVSGYRFSSCD